MLTLALAISAGWHTSYKPEERPPDTEYVQRASDRQIVRTFFKPGFSIISRRVFHTPRLFVLKDGKGKEISSLNDFIGLVNVQTEADALSFVRLQTDNETWRCFYPRSLEVRVTPEPRAGSRWSEGSLGAVWSQPPAEVAKQFPKVRSNGSSFVVERLLISDNMRAKGDEWFLSLASYVTETVSSNGRYKIKAVPLSSKFPVFSGIVWIIGSAY